MLKRWKELILGWLNPMYQVATRAMLYLPTDPERRKPFAGSYRNPTVQKSQRIKIGFDIPDALNVPTVVNVFMDRIHCLVRCRQGGFGHVELLGLHPRLFRMTPKEQIKGGPNWISKRVEPEQARWFALLHGTDPLRIREVMLDAPARIILITRTLLVSYVCLAWISSG